MECKNDFEEEKKNPNERTYEKMKTENYKKVYDQEYGKFHFQIPNPYQRKASFDCSGETGLWNKSVHHEYTVFYQPIKPPGENDWLMIHKEHGQTFTEYKRFGCHQITKEREVIYIAPLSFNVNPAFDKSLLTAMVVLSQSYFFDMKIKLLNLKITTEGVGFRYYEDGTYQLNANDIIEKLFHEKPDDGYCLICLTDIDLYSDVRVIKPRKWIYYPPEYKNDFCYELISYKYFVSICSISRFDPNFSLKKEPETSEEKISFYFSFLKRCAKLMIKNIGHLFGLKNCIFFVCIMNGFNSMKEFDSRPIEVCPCCLRKIFTTIARKYEDINDNGRVRNDSLIIQRFKMIKSCLEENFTGIFDKELEWYNDRLDSLTK